MTEMLERGPRDRITITFEGGGVAHIRGDFFDGMLYAYLGRLDDDRTNIQRQVDLASKKRDALYQLAKERFDNNLVEQKIADAVWQARNQGLTVRAEDEIDTEL